MQSFDFVLHSNSSQTYFLAKVRFKRNFNNLTKGRNIPTLGGSLRIPKHMKKKKKSRTSSSNILNGYPRVLREKEVLIREECGRGRCTCPDTCAPADLH